MKNETRQQAKNLYFQTDLTKTQIAELLNISRRSLHYWIKEGCWDRLKKSAQHMPAILAENCYHIIGHFTDHLLSEHRIARPVTRHEADILHKLVLTVNKLKNRTTLNENMEMFAHFLENVNKKSPELVQQIMPHVDDYLSTRAAVYPQHIMPEHFNRNGFIPVEEKDRKEEHLDNNDYFVWDNQRYFAEKLQQEANTPVINTDTLSENPEAPGDNDDTLPVTSQPMTQSEDATADNEQNQQPNTEDQQKKEWRRSIMEEAERFIDQYPHLFQHPADRTSFLPKNDNDNDDEQKLPEAA